MKKDNLENFASRFDLNKIDYERLKRSKSLNEGNDKGQRKEFETKTKSEIEDQQRNISEKYYGQFLQCVPRPFGKNDQIQFITVQGFS